MNNEIIKYFDNASTTKILEKILDNLKEVDNLHYFNASAIYKRGNESKNFIEEIRTNSLKLLNASVNADLIFNGSATESNHLAVYGSVKKVGKILFSAGEHSSNYEIYNDLKNKGYEVELIKLTNDGTMDIDDFKNKMSESVQFVSVIHVSNETGAINDIKEICKIAKKVNSKVVFHSDGTQAVGKIEVNLDNLGIDMYTFSAHKIGGMKGVGALYIKKNINVKPYVLGGGQEKGKRSGTENILGIYSLGEALKESVLNVKSNYEHALKLNDIVKCAVSNKMGFFINSQKVLNSPYIMSILIDGVMAETIINMMEDNGFIVGSGSACSSKLSGNRVLNNMNLSNEKILGAVRISFSKQNTELDTAKMIQTLIEMVDLYKTKIK